MESTPTSTATARTVSDPRWMLWTGSLLSFVVVAQLGGAVATHLRIADTARAAIPLVVGILAWGGL